MKGIATTLRSMDIELKNADLRKNLVGQPRIKERHPNKVTSIIGIITQGTVVIIVINMVILHKNVLGHILEANPKVG